MSRTNKIIKNAKVSTLFFILTTFIGFYSRNIFLEKLGDEFIGLAATLQSFLGFLNLVELGIGTALGFAMYNSIFNKNHERINELFSLISYLYNKIGKIVFVLGILLSLFFPLIFSKTPINILVIYYAFYAYLFSSLIYYFYNYHLMLLQADQKGYVYLSYQQTLHIIKIIVQIVILYFTTSFTIYITVELINVIVLNILLRRKIKKEYHWLKLDIKGDKSLLSKNKDLVVKIKQVFVHQVSGFILTSTDNIVIFSFVGLKSVTYVNNYYLIIGSGATLVSNFLSGTMAAVGNLVAENDKIKTKKVFWELMSLNHFLGGLLVMALYYGINPVISLWLGERYVVETSIVVIMLANLYISRIRTPVGSFTNAYGLFQDIWAPIAEGLLNLIISIVLAKYYGLIGVMLGTFISMTLIVLIWKPYFLYKNGFKESVMDYWKGFFVLLLSSAITFIICDKIISLVFEIKTNSWWSLIKTLLQIGIVLIIVYSVVMYLLNKGFRDFYSRFIELIRNKVKKI